MSRASLSNSLGNGGGEISPSGLVASMSVVSEPRHWVHSPDLSGRGHGSFGNPLREGEGVYTSGRGPEVRRASGRWIDNACWSWDGVPEFGEFDTLNRGVGPFTFGDGKLLPRVVVLQAVLADLATTPTWNGKRTEVLILSAVFTSLGVVDRGWRKRFVMVRPVRSRSNPFSAGRYPIGNGDSLSGSSNSALIWLITVPYGDDG